MALKLSDFVKTGPEPDLTGTSGTTVAIGNDGRLLVGMDPTERIFETLGPGMGGGLLLANDRAYWGYLGRWGSAVTFNYLNLRLITIAVTSGADVFSGGIFTGDKPPTRGANVTMTKVAATASWDAMIGGVARDVKNSSALGATPAAGSWVYWGIHASGYSTQPTLSNYIRDGCIGRLLSTAAAGSLTGAGPWTAVPIAFVADATALAPRTIVTLD